MKSFTAMKFAAIAAAGALALTACGGSGEQGAAGGGHAGGVRPRLPATHTGAFARGIHA